MERGNCIVFRNVQTVLDDFEFHKALMLYLLLYKQRPLWAMMCIYHVIFERFEKFHGKKGLNDGNVWTDYKTTLASTIVVWLISLDKFAIIISSLQTSPDSLHISSVATTNGDYLKQCAPSVTCDPNAKYRSINGSCNNLQTPTLGASLTPFLRLIDANYSDGTIHFIV